jgi:hypothetical protein
VTGESLAQIFATHTGRLPAVKLPDVSRSGVIVGQDSNGFIELAVDSVVLPIDPDTVAVLITDPVARARLLTDASRTPGAPTHGPSANSPRSVNTSRTPARTANGFSARSATS